jgi:small GTP-binding protein
MQNLEPSTFRVVLVGDSQVGKTSILQTYIHQLFHPDPTNTVGASFHTLTREVSKKKITAQIWDTAGQEKYRSIGPIYYRNAAAALAVFDCTVENFVESLTKWIVSVKRNAEDPLIFVIGNKSDLLSEQQTVVSRMEEFAGRFGAECFLTSAKTGYNIERLFQALFMALARSLKKNMDMIVHEILKPEVKTQCCYSD